MQYVLRRGPHRSINETEPLPRERRVLRVPRRFSYARLTLVRTQGRAPDMRFLSRDTAGRKFIEDHVRLNGAVLMDERVANIMLAGYLGWQNRSF